MIKHDCVFHYNDNVAGMNVDCCYGHCGVFDNCIGCTHYMSIKDTWEFSSVLNLPPVMEEGMTMGMLAGDALRRVLPIVGQASSMGADAMKVMNMNISEAIETMMAEMEKKDAD